MQVILLEKVVNLGNLGEVVGVTCSGLVRVEFGETRREARMRVPDDVPVVFCKTGERKHRIAEDYLAEHTVGIGVFLVLAAIVTLLFFNSRARSLLACGVTMLQ